MPTPAARPRTRTAAAAAPAPVAVAAAGHNSKAMLHGLATSYYSDNKQANAFRSKADGSRKKLLQLMQDEETKPFSVEVNTPDGKITLDVSVDTPDRAYQDVRRLYKLCNAATDPKGLEQFLKIVSATKDAVVAELGTNAAVRCEAIGKGTTNANVKVRK